jgi:Saxitoxin biosynthesis operon protein SxtJ
MSHESFSAHHDQVKSSSDRAFGWVVAMALLTAAVWPFLHGGPVRTWALVAGICMGLIAVVAPRTLAPLNRRWTQLGRLLNRLVSPFVIGCIFFIVMAPAGLLLRLLGKDLLRLRLDPPAESYWISREPPGPDPSSLPQQF